MKKIINIWVLWMVLILGLTGCWSKTNTVTSIEIWHYYNGAQKVVFDQMVMEFNETVGMEKGIIVEAFGQGSINDLRVKIMDSVNKKVGAKEIPNMVTAYGDTAYAMDELGLVVDLGVYMTPKEIGEYVEAYIEEGRLGNENKLKIFPIAKATEVMMVNKTDWDKFAKATGASVEDLESWEGVARTAKAYYEWSGKAFFGRDAMANYMNIGAKQLGKEIVSIKQGQVTLNIDKDIMRKLWDNFYIPYINGYYSSFGKFRTDDAKIGEIIALVGSTTGAIYFPETVTTVDNKSYNVQLMVLPLPNFEGTIPYTIQQGAGMVVLQSDKNHEVACVEFLRWFTQKDRNIQFCLESGYLPVKKVASNIKAIKKHIESNKVNIPKQLSLTLPVAMQQIETYNLYTSKAFKNGIQVRNILTTTLIDKAKLDREAVDRQMVQGKSKDEAVMQYSTDDHFNQWLLNVKASLESAIK